MTKRDLIDFILINLKKVMKDYYLSFINFKSCYLS